jgi:cyanophycinase
MEQSMKCSYLMLVGGAEDRRREKIVLKKIVETSQAKNIVVIPTASLYPKEVASDYFSAFKDLGASTVEIFDIRYNDEVDREYNFQKLELAEMVFFTGGDQVKLVDTLKGSQLLQKIRDRFVNGKLHIAGSSAGATSASNPMIYNGDYKGFMKNTTKFHEGFGWLEGVTIDTHFINRERIPRLVQFLTSGKSKKAIGLDEDTGIIISPDLKFEVIGTGVVTVLLADRTFCTNYNEVADNEHYIVNNVKMGFLPAGTNFNIPKWSVIKK